MSSSTPDQGTRLLLGMTPPPSDRDQERESAAGRRIRTLLDLLTTDKMDGVDRTTSPGGASRWRTLRERLGLKKGIGCCGGAATWRFGSPPLVDDDGDGYNEDGNGVVVVDLETQLQMETRQQSSEAAVGTTTIAWGDLHGNVGMNLAAALAAERQYRGAAASGREEAATPPRTPMRVSLMRLLEESGDHKLDLVEREKGGDHDHDRDNQEGEVGSDRMCCVCMGRKKGAALIPCGHTYCRVCSREVWLNRGCCPLCNRPIIDILDIY